MTVGSSSATRTAGPEPIDTLVAADAAAGPPARSTSKQHIGATRREVATDMVMILIPDVRLQGR
jgi:hypothetical protein